ncbi:cathepsin O-like isoform X2 [Sitophilus oryzae]|uniref:Cathepsin O-like isoform X2 n=1 Tax=Sitophilus oryzae TaxID=7048 RepID=A0A6J2YLP7_SITOR|nr:cathepsin O-like isoform X2 [Sitophilus oryzae]
MVSYWQVLEYGVYFLLLFFMVPIKIENDNDLELFLKYIREFNKSYIDEETFKLRMKAFKMSLEAIDVLNKNQFNSTAVYGLTKFSDLLPKELIYSTNKNHKSKSPRSFKKRSYWKRIPRKIDWREKGIVTKVKNQKNCGACWAFSIIQTVESMMALKYQKLFDLSVQQSVDCSTENFGCLGVIAESKYPYTGANQTCLNTKTSGGIQVTTYSCSSLVNNEDKMLAHLAYKGPLAVAVNALTWQHYVGGIIKFHCNDNFEDLNHSVQIVGYDLNGDIPYYIVRNSWGNDFADGGYLYIAVGKNICGIAHKVTALDVL